MTSRTLRSSAGFTYIMALVMVVIMGIMLGQGAEVWSTKMKREREEELIFRGTQIRNAMRRWHNFKVGPDGKQIQPPVPPQITQIPDLNALVTDPRTPAKDHLLRPSNLLDPITGKEWALVKDPAQNIIGVASTSEAEPLKQGNFPLDLEPADFEGKKKYNEWQFIYNRIAKPKVAGGGIKGLTPDQ